MPSVRELIAIRELGLRCVAGAAGLDHEIRWVHFSEIPDPVAWLRGGELLVTQGLLLEGDYALEHYLRRLAGVGLAAVGFGIGVEYGQVPASLVPIADELGLPLLEVPMATPYVAISEAVSARIAQDQQRELKRSLDAHRELTRAALDTGGAPGTLQVLNRTVGCWAIVTSPTGDPLSAVPAAAAARASDFAPDIEKVRRATLDSAMSLGAGVESVAIQALGALGRRRRFLIAGKEGPFTPSDRVILAAAVSVLSLEAEMAGRVSTTHRFLRDTSCEQLLLGTMAISERSILLSHLGLHADRFRIAVIDGFSANVESPDALEERLDGLGVPSVCFRMTDSKTSWTLLTEERDDLHTVLSDIVGTSDSARVSIGVSRAVGADEIATAPRQAEYARHSASVRGRQVLYFDEIPMHELFLGALQSEALEALQARLLTPLQMHDQTHRGDLVRTVHAYLTANGRWEPTARVLQVHRQTLRNRIGVISDLLDIDLDSPDVRAALWLVLANVQLDLNPKDV